MDATCAGSRSIFNGSDPCLSPDAPAADTRQVVVNVPAAYKDGTEAPIMIMQDEGYGGTVGVWRWWWW